MSNRVTNDHVLALRDAVGPDPVLVERPGGEVTVEPDRAAAVAAGYQVIARRHAASGYGQSPYPDAMAAILSGILDGTTHYVRGDGGDYSGNPFD